MLRALMTLSGLTLVSRVLGLVRDMMINHYLGVGGRSDAWNAAFQLPNLFRRVFGEGAFNAAFIPLYTGKLQKSEGDAFVYGNKVISMLACVLAGLFVIFFIFLPQILWLLNPGYSSEILGMTISLARITLGYLFFICLLAAFSGILNSHKNFTAPAISYVFLNVVFLGGMACVIPFVGKEKAEWVLSWCLLAAGVIQLLIVLVPVWKMGFSFKIRMPKIDSDMKKLGLLMVPGVIGASIQQINLLVSGAVASFQEGGKSLIYNADRINQLPLGLIGIAFGVVLLPEISRKVKANDSKGAQHSLQHGMEMAMLVALPAMVGIGVLAVPILDVLFRSGEFTSDNARMAGQALMVFALSCPAYIMVRVVQPGYFAREDTKTPMRFTFITAVINIFLCLVAYVALHDTVYLFVGCAAATTIAGWVNIILLIRGLRQSNFIKLKPIFWIKLSKMLIASIVMGGALWLSTELLETQLFESLRVFRAMILGLIISTGVVVYFLVVHLIGAAKLADIKAGFRR